MLFRFAQKYLNHIRGKAVLFSSVSEKTRFSPEARFLISVAALATVLLGMGPVYEEKPVVGEIAGQQEIEARQSEELRKRLFDYCGDTANPPICEEIAEAAVKAQNLSGIEGLAKFTLAVASNESRFLPQYCTGNNCLGLGASNPRRHMSFDSHSASVDYLAQLLLNRYGKRPITPSGVWEIASWYAGSPAWAKRILWFMEKLSSEMVKMIS